MTTAIGTYATTAAVKARLFAAGVTDTTDDTLIGTICDQVNGFIESPEGAGRVLAPVGSATYLFDGDGSNTLYVPQGIRAVSALSAADYTGGAKVAITENTDWFLRPLVQERQVGWPAMWIMLSDVPGTRTFFPVGYSTISMTATTGWAAIPDEITGVALTLAVRTWHGRQSGQADIVGNDETGAPLVSRFLSAQDLRTLKRYRPINRPRM